MFLLQLLPTVAQEIRFIDLSGMPQSREMGQGGSRTGYLIYGTEESRAAKRAARASLEWLSTTDINPKQEIVVLVKAENVGDLPISVPVKPRLTDVQSP